jgi:hypothetical protein
MPGILIEQSPAYPSYQSQLNQSSSRNLTYQHQKLGRVLKTQEDLDEYEEQINAARRSVNFPKNPALYPKSVRI